MESLTKPCGQSDTEKPLCIDLFCGLGGWTIGALAEGWRCTGFDIEPWPYPAQLVLQDVLTLHGSQFRNASLIVASPPCTEYSYMAMPWTRSKRITAALRGHDTFPDDYSGSRTIEELNTLFDACFRIQREACEAAGWHIPMVVENVCGAQKWVGRAKWHYGSYYLWGDVPALMPFTKHRKLPGNPAGNGSHWTNPAEWPSDDRKGAWDNSGRGKCRRIDGTKVGGIKLSDVGFNVAAAQRYRDGIKQGGDWFGPGEDCSISRRFSSRSNSRKQASAQIAKIPFALASWIAKCYYPCGGELCDQSRSELDRSSIVGQ